MGIKQFKIFKELVFLVPLLLVIIVFFVTTKQQYNIYEKYHLDTKLPFGEQRVCSVRDFSSFYILFYHHFIFSLVAPPCTNTIIIII